MHKLHSTLTLHFSFFFNVKLTLLINFSNSVDNENTLDSCLIRFIISDAYRRSKIIKILLTDCLMKKVYL